MLALAGAFPEPTDEIDFWQAKAQDLNNIFKQLQSEKVRRMLKVRRRTGHKTLTVPLVVQNQKHLIVLRPVTRLMIPCACLLSEAAGPEQEQLQWALRQAVQGHLPGPCRGQ